MECEVCGKELPIYAVEPVCARCRDEDEADDE